MDIVVRRFREEDAEAVAALTGLSLLLWRVWRKQ